MKKMSNKERVLKYMEEFGSITSLDAFRDLGNTRLSASIWDLIHRDGYEIKSVTEKSKNRWQEETHYSRYYLKDSKYDKELSKKEEK